MQKLSSIFNELKQIYETVGTRFIPAISGDINYLDIERKLLFFPPKLEWLCIPVLTKMADRNFKCSAIISKDFSTKINQYCQHTSNALFKEHKK